MNPKSQTTNPELQSRLLRLAKDLLSQVIYLGPEEFDDDEHESEFNRAVEDARSLIGECEKDLNPQPSTLKPEP